VEGGGDYLVTRHNLLGGSAITQNHVRAYAGVVFTFGSKGASAEQVPEPSAAPTRAARPAPAPRIASAGMKVAVLEISVRAGRVEGAEITDLAPNGVGALVGLHPGDVINAVKGKTVKTPMELVMDLSNWKAGEKVRIGYMLHGQWQAETVILLP
jgi:S1-C subfamily serine protease